jgi:hypothetical protein
LGIVTTTSETAFTQAAETVYDFVTNPSNSDDDLSRPCQNLTLFSRTMTIEPPKHAPLPDRLFEQANPARIDAYHQAVARELSQIDTSAGLA